VKIYKSFGVKMGGMGRMGSLQVGRWEVTVGLYHGLGYKSGGEKLSHIGEFLVNLRQVFLTGRLVHLPRYRPGVERWLSFPFGFRAAIIRMKGEFDLQEI
jgi:hypothetical protein